MLAPAAIQPAFRHPHQVVRNDTTGSRQEAYNEHRG